MLLENKKIIDVVDLLITLVSISSALGMDLINPRAIALLGFIISWSSQIYFKNKSQIFFYHAFKNLKGYFWFLILCSVFANLYIININKSNIYVIGIILLYILNAGLLMYYFVKVLLDLYYFIKN